MSKAENKQNQDIKVTDRRRFTSEGEVKPEDEVSPESPADSSIHQKTKAETESETNSHTNTTQETPSSSEEPTNSSADLDGQALPADFSSLVLSLAASAQSALGIAPNPMTGKVEKNPLQAQHAIDLLSVLQEKTKGNLNDEEDKLMQAVLYDLRMRFVSTQKES